VVFRAVRLGDFLLATPAFRALRMAYPTASITLIGLRSVAAPMVKRFRHYLDRFIEFPGYPGMDEVPISPRLLSFLRKQQSYKYDFAIQLHGAGPASNEFMHKLGAAHTVGSYRGTCPSTLSQGAVWVVEPEISRNLAVTRLLGCPDRGTWLEFPLFPAERREADLLLASIRDSSAPLVGIHAGSGGDPVVRRWPAQRFAWVADQLVDRFGARIILTGHTTELDLGRHVASLMRRESLNLVGRASLGAMAAVIGRCDLFVCNDTGPAHLADALDTLSVTIFGSANPVRWRSLNQVRHPSLAPPVAEGQVLELATTLLQHELSR
jgi:ADP-heptose:LPS heptosyltransferase